MSERANKSKSKVQKRNAKKGAGRLLVPLWVWIVSVLLIGFGVAFVARWGMGEMFATDYAQGIYREDIPDVLRAVNVPQPEVGDYDMGLLKYREGKYDEAAELFYQAASCGLPEGQDCDVRVNLALATCNQMDLEAARAGDEEARSFALECLYYGRDVLLENGCAADDDSFHDKDAQQLKEDIDKLIEELEQKQNPSDGDSDGDNDDNDNDNDDSRQQPPGGLQEQQDPLREQLREQQKQNSQQMEYYQEEQNYLDEFFDMGGFNENGNIGGSGQMKPW